MIVTTKATLSITIDVECPECEHDFDLISDTHLNDEGWLMDKVMPEGKTWSENHEHFRCYAICPECSSEFEINGIVY